MKFVLFIGWILLIVVCSDLVGSALRLRLSFLPERQALATGARVNIGGPGALADFVHSTLLGFTTLWVSLSLAYVFGIATQRLIIATVGFATIAAALAQRRNVVRWAYSRIKLWGLVGAAALLASLVTPTINPYDDPEYFFLISKILRTGSIVEYFSVRRPITLGGWTFIQAIFSAGPAGAAFVASIDVILGSILFLLCAILLGAGVWPALPTALTAVLAVQHFQVNLGTAIGMAGMCAVVACLSLPACAPRNSFTPVSLAVMAVTIRPQLGLIAITGIAAFLCHNRARSLLIGAAVVTGVSAIWAAIFLRDTGLLPLSMSPGYNPQLANLIEDPLLYHRSTLSDLASVCRQQWAVAGLTSIAAVICGGQSVTSKHGAATRNEFRVIGAFCIAAAATVVGMVWASGPRGADLQRYYIPIADGVLYVFLIRSAVHFLQRGPYRLSKSLWLPVAGMTIVWCIATLRSAEKLSAPTELVGRICNTVLTAQEQRVFEALPSVGSYTLLAIECPVGNFEISSHTMLGDLFWSTRGDYFDIDWKPERSASWLQTHGVDRLVYLDNDRSPTFGLALWRTYLEQLKSPSSDSALEEKRELSYEVESLEKFRTLSQHCESLRIPIQDPQGPLVVVDLRQCKGRDSTR